MILPKPFLGRAVIEAIETSSEDYLLDRLRNKIGKEALESAKKSGIILDDPDILRESCIDQHTGKTMLGKSKAENKVPLFRGKIIDMAPDFCGESFENKCGTDVGYKPKLNDIVYFVPNETMAIDPNKKYHLINDCDIVGYITAEEYNKELTKEIEKSTHAR